MKKVNMSNIVLATSLAVLLTACGGSDGIPSSDLGNSTGSGHNGNTSGNTGSGENEVADTNAPVITITGDKVVRITKGSNYNDKGATATDDVDGKIDIKASGLEDINTSTAGTYTIAYSATDSAGNTATQKRTVNVINSFSTNIFLNGDNTLHAELNRPFIDPGATAEDTQGSDITSSIKTSSNVNPKIVGTDYKVTYRVADGLGNSSTVARKVEVSDKEKPIVTLIGNKTITIDDKTTYKELNATVTDNSFIGKTKNIEPFPIIPPIGITAKTPGSYTIEYIYNDGANEGKAQRKVNIVKTPVLILAGDNPLKLKVGDKRLSDPGVKEATDRYGSKKDLKSKVKTAYPKINFSTPGNYTISYSLTDGGDTTTITRDVNVTDQTPPVIKLKGVSPIDVIIGTPYVDAGATAKDNVDGDLTIKDGKINTSKAGNYTVKYNVTDKAGNKAAEVTRTVNVYDPSKQTN